MVGSCSCLPSSDSGTSMPTESPEESISTLRSGRATVKKEARRSIPVQGRRYGVDSSRRAGYHQPKHANLQRRCRTGSRHGPVRRLRAWVARRSQPGKSLDARQENLKEVVAMLLEDGDPRLESEFIGVQTIRVA